MPRSPKLESIQKREQTLRDRIAKMRQDLQRAEAAERHEEKRQHRKKLWSIATLYEESGALDMKLELDPEMLLGAFVHLTGQAKNAECRSLWKELGRQKRAQSE